MIKPTYFSFTEKGKEGLPSQEEITFFLKDNTEPVVFLDSCVCLDIVKIIDHKKKAQNASKEKVMNLKKYLSISKLRIKPMFGLMELCYDQDRFNERKFWDFNNRIRYYEEIPLKYFQGFKFDFNRDFFLLYTPDLKLQITFQALESFFLNTYCSLLKIRELSINGLSKAKSKNNISEFFNWMSCELGIILGIEYFLALKIFGGSTEFRKMIWLDGKQDIIKKKLIGTAWDIFHTRLSTNTFEFNKLKLLENKKIYSYFLTNDFDLFNLFAYYGLFCTIDKKNDTGTIRLFNTDLNVPHFDSKFIDEQNMIMFEALTNRFDKIIENNLTKTKLLIQALEIKNSIA